MGDDDNYFPDASELKPKSVSFYQRVLAEGSGTQWRALLKQCEQNYDIAYQVGRAIARMPDQQFRTVKVLWAKAVEFAQPGLRIQIFHDGYDPDAAPQQLRQDRYSEHNLA